MKLSTILTTAAIALAATAGSAQAGDLFVESRTAADLTVNGDTGVLSSVNVGGTFFSNYAITDVYGGVGYSVNSREDLAINTGVRSFAFLGNSVALEAELDVTYYTQADQLTFTPELRVRKYFGQ